MNCTGAESSLKDCQTSYMVSNQNCGYAGVFCQSKYCRRTLACAIRTNTQKFKRIKGPCTTTSKYCSLIMYILDHIKENQKANFWLNFRVFQYHIQGPLLHIYIWFYMTFLLLTITIDSSETRQTTEFPSPTSTVNHATYSISTSGIVDQNYYRVLFICTIS